MNDPTHIDDRGQIHRKWKVEKYASGVYEAGGEPYETVEIQGNLLLNEGIQLLEDLMIGAGGTSWDNANARLGVGDSNAAEAATQTDLQGTNKTYKAMEATYPQRSGQTLTWRSVFADAEGNHAWAEVSLSNAADGTGVNLNRKVQDLGTKATGTWTLELQITFS
ncbi:hypothetical protein [Candidatus Endoriftia persephonae]|jgi:hypothetical protein|uniref:Uncharacterized protein n=2 Tax=Gammaproteobacteria TaxID=1236 RepID=G2FD84_9GAMM|nr:hypothetical protein [Candidatus Endoriftia persephone]EGW55170.1 hypothetical protein TevJSym_ae00270 [endosymbiont of Tevnia jerichonana (vent Tica)]USF88742.1 hypothetical protein L0Y14_05785 [Candidatus Endoriftia persephone]